ACGQKREESDNHELRLVLPRQLEKRLDHPSTESRPAFVLLDVVGESMVAVRGESVHSSTFCRCTLAAVSGDRPWKFNVLRSFLPLGLRLARFAPGVRQGDECRTMLRRRRSGRS